MNRLFAAAWVIARRDFVATVWSKTFLLFLLAPVLLAVTGALVGQLTKRADIAASQPVIAVAMDEADAEAIGAAHRRVVDSLGELVLPAVRFEEPAPNPNAQARLLLSSEESNVSAVLTGSLARPTLTGPRKSLERLSKEIGIVIADARRSGALAGAGLNEPPLGIQQVTTAESRGSLNMVQHLLARGTQMLVFLLTLMLATMMLSNLVEEKSNKVIEILAASVPLDAVFLGKLIAMLGISGVGILIWGALTGIGIYLVQDLIPIPVKPEVGWLAFGALVALYFAANFMLLGAFFLCIGGQASNIREVQTLSMPITLGQVLVFLLASMVVGDGGGTMTWTAALFPLSSPLAMIALAAQSPSIWPHLLALAWQLLWIFIIVRVSARMFRRTVLKSVSPENFFAILKQKA